MAYIEKRPSKNGKTTRYRVRWRTGGRRDGDWDGQTFDDQADAKRFHGLVEACRDQYPRAEQLIAHGFAELVSTPDPASAPVAPQPAPEPEQAPAPITFEEYAREYVAGLIKPNRETRRKYLERLVNNVFPVLGARPIAEITRREIREWQQGLIAQGLSAKTIANIRGESVVPIFEAACRPGEDDEPPLRSYNPVKGLPLPEGVRIERDIIETEREAKIFIEAAYEVDPNAADLLVATLSTGLRWGEVSGLPVCAVHPARGTVSIRQVLRREHHTWVVVAKPKTRKGYRQVPVPAQVMAMLKRRCEGRKRDDFVFTAPEGGFWRYAKFYDGRWKKIRALAESRGIDKHLTPHGLRHSLLTLLATEGVDLAALQQIAGHKRISTTFDVYVHATSKHHDPVRKIVTGFVGNAAVPGTGDRDPATADAVGSGDDGDDDDDQDGGVPALVAA